MSPFAMKIIRDSMQELGVEYSLGTYNKHPIVYPYFVGQYTEIPSDSEDGFEETDLMLMGYSRTTIESLEEVKAKLRSYFPPIGGRRFISDDGSALIIMFSDAHLVVSGDPEIKRNQINLTIKEWMVN